MPRWRAFDRVCVLGGFFCGNVVPRGIIKELRGVQMQVELDRQEPTARLQLEVENDQN